VIHGGQNVTVIYTFCKEQEERWLSYFNDCKKGGREEEIETVKGEGKDS